MKKIALFARSCYQIYEKSFDLVQASLAYTARADLQSVRIFRVANLSDWAITQGSTDNLMDYSDGLALYKPQWDLIHNPEFTTGLWDGMEDGASVGANNPIEAIKGANEQMIQSVTVSNTWKKEEDISVQLDSPPMLPTMIKSKILNANCQIPTLVYSKEDVGNTNEVKLTFFYQSVTEMPALTFQFPKSKLSQFLHYLGIDIRIEGAQLLDGQLVAFITGLPVMPTVKLTFPTSDGGPIEIEQEVRYEVLYTYEGENYPFKDDLHPLLKTTVNGNEYTLNWRNNLQGGDATIRWKQGNRQGTKKILIRAINPTQSAIKVHGELLGCNRYWFFWKITKKESDFRQFYSDGKYTPIDPSKPQSNQNGHTGLPLWGGPKGFGLKQLDNWKINGIEKECSPLQRWNWKENLQGGMEVLNEKEGKVNEKRIEHANIINQWNDLNKDDLVSDSLRIIAGEGNETTILTITEGKEAFAVSPTSVQRNIYDAMLIKLFNGGNFYYQILLTPNSDPSKRKPYRAVNRTNNKGKNYVNEVCNLTD